jgi:hypothetical protein
VPRQNQGVNTSPPDSMPPDLPPRATELIRAWRESDREKTLGGLIDAIDSKGFALLLVILLGPSALPIPTGGLTHVFEVAAALLALQLIAGRREVWLPERIRRIELGGEKSAKAVDAIERYIGKLERITRPRGRIFFGRRISDVLFGCGVLIGVVATFLAPPFTGLDTVPALGVVLLALAVIAEDIAVIWVGVALIALGIFLELFLGDAALRAVKSVF